MSTNSECEFFIFNAQHFYVLEHYNAPKNAWDWRDHATCYGPFPTREKAKEDLDRNHANPGGWNENNTDQRGSDRYAALVKGATAPRSQSFGGHYLGWRPR